MLLKATAIALRLLQGKDQLFYACRKSLSSPCRCSYTTLNKMYQLLEIHHRKRTWNISSFLVNKIRSNDLVVVSKFIDKLPDAIKCKIFLKFYEFQKQFENLENLENLKTSKLQILKIPKILEALKIMKIPKKAKCPKRRTIPPFWRPCRKRLVKTQ